MNGVDNVTIIIIFYLLSTKFTDKVVSLHISCAHYSVCGATQVFRALNKHMNEIN